MPRQEPPVPKTSSDSLLLPSPGAKPIALSNSKLQAYLDVSNNASNPREPSAGGLINASTVIEFLKSPAGRDLLADWREQLIELAQAKDAQEFFAREAQKRNHKLFSLLLLALFVEKEAAAEDLAKAIERQAEEARKQHEADEKHETEEAAAKIDYDPDEYDPLIRAAEDSIAEKQLELDPVNQELNQLEKEKTEQNDAHQKLRQLKAQPAQPNQSLTKQIVDIQTRIEEQQKKYPDLETRLTRLRSRIEKMQQEISTLTAKKDVLVNSRNEALQRRQEENNQRRLATSTSPTLTTSANTTNTINPTGNQQGTATKPRPSGEAISSRTAPNTSPNPLTTRPAPTPTQTPQSRPTTQHAPIPTNKPPRTADLRPPASSNPQQKIQQQIRRELANINAASKSKTSIQPQTNQTPNNEAAPNSSPSPLKINPKQGS